MITTDRMTGMPAPVVAHNTKNIVTPKKGCRIFLVEHDSAACRRETGRLEAADFVDSVKCFKDCNELFAYMESEGFYDRSVLCLTPTLIIIALSDAGVHEIWALERLKSDTFLTDIPLLALAAPGDIHPSVPLHADGVIGRPLDPVHVRSHAAHGWQWPTQEMWLS